MYPTTSPNIQSNHRLLGRDEERELIEHAQAGDQCAVEKILEHNQRLVLTIAAKFKNNLKNGLELADLIQCGNIGVLTAIRKFELARNVRFSTYAYPWIAATIRRECLLNSTVSLSVRDAEFLSRIKHRSFDLTKTMNREPNLNELATALSCSTEKVKSLLLTGYVYSLDTPFDPDNPDGVALGDIVPSGAQHIENGIDDWETIDCLVNSFLHLPALNRRILALRLGLNSPRYSFVTISKRLNMKTDDVRSVFNESINRLRDAQMAEQ